MALTSCRECGKQVSTEAPACPQCGVPEPSRGHAPPPPPVIPAREVRPAGLDRGVEGAGSGMGWIISAGVAVGVIVLVAAFYDPQSPQPPSVLHALTAEEAKQKARIQDSTTAYELLAKGADLVGADLLAFEKLAHRMEVPPAHDGIHSRYVDALLDSAEVLFKPGRNGPYGPEHVAWMMEETVLGPDITKAQRSRRDALMREVSRRRAREQEQALRAAAKERKQERINMAERMEYGLLDDGYNATVTTRGADNTTLRIEWILVNRVVVHQFTKRSDFFSNLREVGFKRLEITDGYDSTWTWTLD